MSVFAMSSAVSISVEIDSREIETKKIRSKSASIQLKQKRSIMNIEHIKKFHCVHAENIIAIQL